MEVTQMKNIIQRLYDGELYESGNIIDKAQWKKTKTEESRGKAHDALWNTLSASQQDLFRAWELESSNIWTEEIEEAYTRGFKIGALLGFEINNVDFDD